MTLKKKRLVVNIIFYAFIALIYVFVIIMVVTKFNNGTIYLFDTRYDVVLTNSMSDKNPEHLDFLQGTTQFQAGDVLRSKKLHEDTKLNIKDVVLFKSPELGNKTASHRIVEIKTDYDVLSAMNVELVKLFDVDGIKFLSYASRFEMDPISITGIDIEYVSLLEGGKDYSVNIGGQYYLDLDRETTKLDNYYLNKLHYSSASAAAKLISIYRASDKETYVTSIKFTTTAGKEFIFNAVDYVEPSEGVYHKYFNPIESYRLRGDLAKDYDNGGKYFSREDIYARVENVIPKLGYAISFLTSIPGIIMFVGLAFIITGASFLYNHLNKKKDLELADKNGSDVQQAIDNQEDKLIADNDRKENVDEEKID